jgi:CRP-like cAMP-binding protein
MRRNALLAALEPEHQEWLQNRGQIQSLEGDVCLQHLGEPVEQVFFPLTAVLTVCAGTVEGERVSVATVGPEGGLGLLEACGSRHAHESVEVLLPGAVLRLNASAFRTLHGASPALRTALHRYTESTLAEARLGIACNALHTVEMRLCKVLLELSDRFHDPLFLTQEALSHLLGVQRTTVAAAMSALQKRGVVRSRRGKVQILDAEALDAAACGCRQTLAFALREIQSSTAPVCDP